MNMFEGTQKESNDRNNMENEATVAKKQFLSNISHELRTPIHGIIGFIDLLQDTSLTEKQREYLNIISESASSLKSKIIDILELSDIKKQKPELTMTCFDLRAMLIEIVEGFAEMALLKNIELKSIAMPDVPDRITGDPLILRRALSILLDNAIKFTEKGEVALSVGRIEQAGDEVCLHFFVSDTGIGIRKDLLEIIEDEFVQGDGSVTRRFDGLGLGLAIASPLIKMMKGELQVQSVHEQGSIFHFRATFGI
jgi:signal transduction histidine kinase